MSHKISSVTRGFWDLIFIQNFSLSLFFKIIFTGGFKFSPYTYPSITNNHKMFIRYTMYLCHILIRTKDPERVVGLTRQEPKT